MFQLILILRKRTDTDQPAAPVAACAVAPMVCSLPGSFLLYFPFVFRVFPHRHTIQQPEESEEAAVAPSFSMKSYGRTSYGKVSATVVPFGSAALEESRASSHSCANALSINYQMRSLRGHGAYG